MRILLALPVLALTAAPALARPDLPQGTFKPEVQMRMHDDGRADRQMSHVAHVDRPDAYQASPAQGQGRVFDSMGRGSHFQAPVKADIALKMQSGDSREGSAAKSAAAQPAPAGDTQSLQTRDLMGRNHPVAIPLKSQIMLKMQNGDSRESSSSKAAARPSGGDKSAHQPVLSKAEKTALCRQTGVCIPSLEGSDNTEDKTE